MHIAGFEKEQLAYGFSRNTVGARIRCIKAIARRAGVAPGQLTAEAVLTYLANAGLGTWSRRTYLNHLSAFGKHIGVDLVGAIRKPPAPRSIPDPLSEQDLATLIAAARGRVRAWVLLGAYCGLRAHETAKIAAEDMSREGDEVTLRVLGKGGRTDVLPVPPIVVTALDLSRPGPLWVGITPYRVSRTVALLASRQGIGMRYHQLRHRYGTAVYRSSGRDLLLTQRLMRHSSPATTAGYAAVADDQMHVIARALPGADPASGES
ncbi:hypothetical protein GCM10009634_27740 [Saccharothrix xinjiangensis]